MISFLVCAFNEEKYIKATIDTINKSVNNVGFIDKFEIVIVNDGSNDLTEKNIEELKKEFNNIISYNNDKNSGAGYSIRKGLTLIKYPKFMILPGDNDISVEGITSALKHSRSIDLVMLFPINTEIRTKFRNILSKIYSLIYVIFFDCCVNYINGPSIMPTEHVKNLDIRSNRNGITSEIITKLLRSDITYHEVPAFMKFQEKKERSTVTLKVLYDVTITFMKLFIEMKIIKRNKFTKKAKRK